MLHRNLIPLLVLATFLLIPPLAWAESQENEYKGITDPFGDPANYEFAEDEKEDKEFFHLGRYLMFGFDVGAGIFTMGLGRNTDAAFYGGARLIYFFDKHIGFEVAAHYARHLGQISNGSSIAELDVQLIPLTGAFRYYFETKESPRALAIANPYVVMGAGSYYRSQRPTSDPGSIISGGSEGTNFGLQAGGGLEFSIYRRHVYLGIDFRYHAVFFEDEDGIVDSNTGQLTISGDDRSGDYITSALTLTYNF